MKKRREREREREREKRKENEKKERKKKRKKKRRKIVMVLAFSVHVIFKKADLSPTYSKTSRKQQFTIEDLALKYSADFILKSEFPCVGNG